MFPPPALIVIAPNETNVADKPPLLVTVKLFAVINPVAAMCTFVALAEVLLLTKVTTPPVTVPVNQIPLPPEVVVLVMAIA